jgi:hypothetical protein
MPYQEADDTDPLLLVGVELPAEAGAAREAVQVIAEEYARMGYGEKLLMELFANPFYGGAHQAYLALGEDAVRAIVREQTAFWGRVQIVDRDTDPATDMRLLHVLEPMPPAAARKEHHA